MMTAGVIKMITLEKRIGVVIGGFGVLMLTNDVTENFPTNQVWRCS